MTHQGKLYEHRAVSGLAPYHCGNGNPIMPPHRTMGTPMLGGTSTIGPLPTYFTTAETQIVPFANYVAPTAQVSNRAGTRPDSHSIIEPTLTADPYGRSLPIASGMSVTSASVSANPSNEMFSRARYRRVTGQMGGLMPPRGARIGQPVPGPTSYLH